MTEQMSSNTKLIILNALLEYKDTSSKPWAWGNEDAQAIEDAETWVYEQLLPEDKGALRERFDQIEKEMGDLKREIDVLGDKRYELIKELIEVRKLLNGSKDDD